MAPPMFDVLPNKLQLVSVRVPLFKTPPPLFGPGVGLPFDTVRPVIVAVTPLLIVKMRKNCVPLTALRMTVNRFAPSPVIVRSLLISNSPDVSVIVWPDKAASKVIVLPGQALLMIARKDPAPLSLLLV